MSIHAEIDTLLDFGEWQKAKDLIATLIDPSALAFVTVKEPCFDCEGSGTVPTKPNPVLRWANCTTCKGTGKVKGAKEIRVMKECEECHGRVWLCEMDVHGVPPAMCDLKAGTSYCHKECRFNITCDNCQDGKVQATEADLRAEGLKSDKFTMEEVR